MSVSADNLHKHGRGLVLFGLVGAMNSTVDFVAFSAGVLLGAPPVLANILAFCVANPFSYVVNSRVTFRGEAGPAALSFRGYGKFCAAHLLSLTISTGMVFFLSPVIGPFIAKLMAMGVTLFINYFSSALLVFKPGEDSHAERPESP